MIPVRINMRHVRFKTPDNLRDTFNQHRAPRQNRMNAFVYVARFGASLDSHAPHV